MGRKLDETQFVDLVALGTVIDVAPLEDENRRIVVAGLEQMRQGMRPGLEALTAISRVQPEPMNAESLGFALGPRLNAAGRIQHAYLALDLVLARGPAHRPPARGAARWAKSPAPGADRARLRHRRGDLRGRERPADHGRQPGHQLRHRRNRGRAAWPSGITARPSSTRRGELTSRASCRSIPEFDIVGAIRKEKELLVRHGGHRAAAGFTVDNRTPRYCSRTASSTPPRSCWTSVRSSRSSISTRRRRSPPSRQSRSRG